MAEQKMNFYRSLYDLASILPSEKGRRRLLVAMLDYFFEGIEPDGFNANEAKAFEAVRGRIDASKRNANNKRVSVANETANDDGGFVANETSNETSNGTRRAVANETANETDNDEPAFDGDRQRLPLYSPSYSPSQGERTPVSGCTPPSLEEVKAYFATNCLMGDPEAFYATYESQGWVKGNGMPVHSWEALAVKWGIEERIREAAKPPEQRSRPLAKADNALDPVEELRKADEEYRRLMGDGD